MVSLFKTSIAFQRFSAFAQPPLTHQQRVDAHRLAATCRRLDHPANTAEIFVGLQTSADAVYHLEKLAPGRYLCRPPGKPRQPAYEVLIEDAIMKPLVSGAEAKRFVTPKMATFLLFSYERRDGADIAGGDGSALSSRLGASPEFEAALRSRESNSFDDDEWYRFGRTQNLDKQDKRKLIVAGTVPSMRICFDLEGIYALNNVRVNGILAADDLDPWFLLGILNSRVIDFVFQQIAKPKDGGWFEANKQFIAPLPILQADATQKMAVAAIARDLQELHSRRRDLLERIADRFAAAPRRPRPESWLFPALALDAAGIAARCQAIEDRLHADARLSAEEAGGELRFLIGGLPVIAQVFVDPGEAAFLLAQWQRVAATFNPAMKDGAKALIKALRDVAGMENRPLVAQLIEAVRNLSVCETAITAAEKKLEAKAAELYRLTQAEHRLIQA